LSYNNLLASFAVSIASHWWNLFDVSVALSAVSLLMSVVDWRNIRMTKKVSMVSLGVNETRG